MRHNKTEVAVKEVIQNLKCKEAECRAEAYQLEQRASHLRVEEAAHRTAWHLMEDLIAAHKRKK